MNYFKFFGLEFSYFIKTDLLIHCYQKLQKKYHPDFVLKTNKKQEKKIIEKSALINLAYKTLKDPLLRINHILYLKKININKKKYQINDLKFLKKKIKLYDKIEFLKKKKNNKKISLILSYLKKTKKKYIKKIEKEIKLENWKKVAKIFNKIFFVNEIEKKINQYKYDFIENFKN